jgi:hypothetical protein
MAFGGLAPTTGCGAPNDEQSRTILAKIFANRKTTGRMHPRLDKLVNCSSVRSDELPVEKQARRADNEANSSIHLGFHRHASFQRLATRRNVTEKQFR